MIDENACRFGHWFTANKEKIKDDTKAIASLNSHHAIVHQEAKHAVKLWGEGQFIKAIEVMSKVEHSSEVGFEELYSSFINHRR